MLTLRLTREGIEVVRFMPFIFFGNEVGRASSSSNSPALPINERRENGKTKTTNQSIIS